MAWAQGSRKEEVKTAIVAVKEDTKDRKRSQSAAVDHSIAASRISRNASQSASGTSDSADSTSHDAARDSAAIGNSQRGGGRKRVIASTRTPRARRRATESAPDRGAGSAHEEGVVDVEVGNRSVVRIVGAETPQNAANTSGGIATRAMDARASRRELAETARHVRAAASTPAMNEREEDVARMKAEGPDAAPIARARARSIRSRSRTQGTRAPARNRATTSARSFAPTRADVFAQLAAKPRTRRESRPRRPRSVARDQHEKQRRRASVAPRRVANVAHKSERRARARRCRRGRTAAPGSAARGAARSRAFRCRARACGATQESGDAEQRESRR